MRVKIKIKHQPIHQEFQCKFDLNFINNFNFLTREVKNQKKFHSLKIKKIDTLNFNNFHSNYF